MTHVDISSRHPVARRREKRPPTPSQCFISLGERYPDESREELIERFGDLCEAGGPIARQAGIEWAQIKGNRLIAPTSMPTRRPAESAKESADRNRRVAETINRTAVKLVLSRELEINGKKLKYFTFAEVGKLGGQLAKLATKGRPRQLVGAVFRTDAALRKALA